MIQVSPLIFGSPALPITFAKFSFTLKVTTPPQVDWIAWTTSSAAPSSISPKSPWCGPSRYTATSFR